MCFLAQSNVRSDNVRRHGEHPSLSALVVRGQLGVSQPLLSMSAIGHVTALTENPVLVSVIIILGFQI